MDRCTHYSNDKASYPSTAYQPVDPAFGPHATYHQDTKTEEYASANPEGVTVDRQSQPLGFRSLRWWLAEIMATLVSIASFVAIVVVARKYRGQGLQDVHLPSQLSLNGLIALLSTVCRIALMIPVESAISQEVWTWLYGTRVGNNRRQLRDLEISDEASRGAWGSFRFLLQARRNWLAYLATLLTLLTVVFGTFTQQLLTIGSFSVSDPVLMPGHVPRSNNWQPYFVLASEGSPTPEGSFPPLAFKAAAYNSALTASSTTLIADCPTGNCTWPTTPSLAVCGGCVNSTWDISCGQIESDGESQSVCQYHLPSGEIANISDFRDLDMGVGFQVFPSTGFVFDPSRTDMMFLVNFEAVGSPNDTDPTWKPANNASTVAVECALWMCIQSYETKQIDAKQTQTVLKEYSIVDNSSLILPESNITFVNIPSDMNVIPSSVYYVDSWAYFAMQNYLGSLFSGNITLRMGHRERTVSSDITSGIWNSSADLDTWIKSLATGLSNVVRTYSPPTEAENDFYKGVALQLGYDIRWAWISLPAASVVLSLFIMFVIIIRTARSPVRAWKGSALTLLFTDVDPELKNQVTFAMDRHEGIKNLAGKTPVILEDRGYGNWRIRKT